MQRQSVDIVSSRRGGGTSHPDADGHEDTAKRTAASSNGGTALINGVSNSHHSTRAVPGRPRRKQRSSKHKRGGRRSSSSFWHRFYNRWFKGVIVSFSSLFLAVLLWYLLGVISIGTSKLLLMQNQHQQQRQVFGGGGVPPLYLTLQQQLIGVLFLRFLLQIRFLGSSGLQPWPAAAASASNSSRRYSYGLATSPSKKKRKSFLFDLSEYQPSLLLAGVFFCFGFLFTNYGFSGSSAAFVETIKAAEPLTSAVLAVWWGIEVLSSNEVFSLLAIVAGVLLSTLGNGGDTDSSATTLSDSVQACVIVMASNLCFSCRGLYQKLFRATSEGSVQLVDDLNLQFRMQQIGVVLLLVPVLIFDMPSILRHLWYISTQDGLIQSGILVRYLSLALLNGFAFSGYNLASTFILSRISVVHHAALNCIRRIFAIVVTSIAFSVPITLTGVCGIIVSITGFMSFTHYKVQRQRQPKPISSLLPISAVN